MLTGGIDPGKVAAVCLLRSRRLVLSKTIRGDKLDVIVATVQGLKKLGEENGGILMAIEMQFAGRGEKSNPKSLAELLRRRHMWEFSMELMGIDFVQVYPATWQTQLRAAARYGPKGGKRTSKERSIEVATMHYGSQIVGDAQADAALIARWLANKP